MSRLVFRKPIGVRSIDPEVIIVNPVSYWGHRATVAPPAEVVFTFQGFLGTTFGQTGAIRRDS